ERGIATDSRKIEAVQSFPIPRNLKQLRDENGQERVIFYASRTLTSAEKNYTITENKCLAIVSRFVLYTDHSALKYLFDLKLLQN
ncbi:10181_t:CDS:2, partial [Gigaspora margarita]